MGQQQLILLVLATVIVGIAIVVGIRAFTENSIKASVDAMTQDAVRIANDAQAWKKKPAPFGGDGDNANPVDFSNLDSVRDLGYTPAGAGAMFYSNLNGCYELTSSTTSLIIHGVNVNEKTEVSITVTGLTDAAINPTANFPILGTSSITTDPCGAPPPPPAPGN